MYNIGNYELTEYRIFRIGSLCGGRPVKWVFKNDYNAELEKHLYLMGIRYTIIDGDTLAYCNGFEVKIHFRHPRNIVEIEKFIISKYTSLDNLVGNIKLV